MLSCDTVLDRPFELKVKGVPFVLATVVRRASPTSAKPGTNAFVEADGGISTWIGGGCAQPGATV